MAAFAAISVGLLFAVAGRLPRGHDFVFPRYLLAMPILGVGSIASTYANFVVTVAADRRLRGNPIPVRKALGVANRRLRPLLAWWALSLVVGFVLQVLAERIKVAGPMRPPRRSERFPSLVRVDTINGKPADEVSEGTRFDDLPVAFPADRLELGSDDATVKAIE